MSIIKELAKDIGAKISDARSVWQATNDAEVYIYEENGFKIFFSQFGFFEKHNLVQTKEVELILVKDGESTTIRRNFQKRCIIEEWDSLKKELLLNLDKEYQNAESK